MSLGPSGLLALWPIGHSLPKIVRKARIAIFVAFPRMIACKGGLVESIRRWPLGLILGRAGCGPPALSNSAFINKPSGTVDLASRHGGSELRSTQLLHSSEVSLFACHSRSLMARGGTSRGEWLVFA